MMKIRLCHTNSSKSKLHATGVDCAALKKFFDRVRLCSVEMPSDKRKKSSTASSSSSAYSPPTGEDAAERSRPGVRRRVSSSSHIRSASASPSRAAAAAGGHEQSVPIILEAGDTGAGNKNRVMNNEINHFSTNWCIR